MEEPNSLRTPAVSSRAYIQPVPLTEEQKAMLHLSEEDIKHGRLILQEELAHQDQKWLNGLLF